MAYLFSQKGNSHLKELNLKEKELNDFLANNWEQIFPHLTFVQQEFELKGRVRGKDGTGYVDILAYNPQTKRFVIVELKRIKDKNIRNQAGDYRDYVERNFAEICLKVKEETAAKLPHSSSIDASNVEIILVAKEFYEKDMPELKRKDQILAFVKYKWFKSGDDRLLFYEFVSPEPDMTYKAPSTSSSSVKIAKEPKPEDKITPVNRALQHLGGGELIRGKGIPHFHKLNNGRVVNIRYSKHYPRSDDYWYGITPDNMAAMKEHKVTHVCLIMGEHGVASIPINTMQEYLETSANYTANADGSVKNYHVFIKNTASPLLYTRKDRKMWKIRSYVSTFG